MCMCIRVARPCLQRACENFHNLLLQSVRQWMKLKSFWGEQPDHWPFGQWSGTFFCGCADSADPPDQFNNLFSTRQPTYAPRTLPTPLARNAVVVPTISPSDRPTAPPTLTPMKLYVFPVRHAEMLQRVASKRPAFWPVSWAAEPWFVCGTRHRYRRAERVASTREAGREIREGIISLPAGRVLRDLRARAPARPSVRSLRCRCR